VIHELAHERGARGMRRVVGVVHIQGRVDDQIDRRLGLVCRAAARRQSVAGVQNAAALADRDQRPVEPVALPFEEGIEPGEHAAEHLRPEYEALGKRIAGAEKTRGAQRAHRPDEPAPVDAGMTPLGLKICLACHAAVPFMFPA
jgi:hypothetical protein